jgi:hypothetical protein
MDDVISLNTRNKAALLDAMMQSFASANSCVSFEGHLYNTTLTEIAGASQSESSVLKRATTWPKLDFIILPLNNETISAIKKAIASRVGFGENGIVHVQIQKDEELAFAAYDGFHDDTVVLFSRSADHLLEPLVTSGVLWSYKRVSK